LLPAEDVEKAAKLGDINIIVEANNPAAIAKKGARTLLVGISGDGRSPQLPSDSNASKDLQKLKELKGKFATCGYVEIHSKAHERLAAAEAKVADFVIVVGKDWTIIPLENLIAELQKEKCKIIAGVKNAKEAKVAFETLEVGVDGVLLQTASMNEIKRTAKLFESAGKLPLKVAKIKTLKPVSMGDRVCIDTASLLSVGEGMLIGSQSNGLFLVHSETLETEYVSSRPFRVNAGAVHAYVLAPDMKTKYLSELCAGDEVLAIDKNGNTRSVVIGRVKIEKRPLMLLEAKCGGKLYKTLLQNAETITLLNEKGKPVSISKLKKGDGILIYTKDAARHFGMEVEESIIER
ncbi:MAG: 3-dehydroquinate synthase II, partial [Candidatus Hydrothermarchaeaceae archaeon]